jgi:hypothetical protein
MPKPLTKVGVIYPMTMRDEAGRAVDYFVQLGPGPRVVCWTAGADDVAPITPAELFAACLKAKGER